MLLSSAFGLRLSQAEVDFVIPDAATDIPLCIDPFLLYKSRDPALRDLHSQLLSIFQRGIDLFRTGQQAELERLIDFPEVNEIGFGYSAGAIRGSGLGSYLNQLLAETLGSSEALQERGLRHIEELQLVAIGVGADRISDIAGNVLKNFLINYTQQQAQLWGIPLQSTMPVSHYFDFESWEWCDGYFDLPSNPISHEPVLLVPRRIVRLLPWINYDDFVRSDFRMFLRPRLPRYPGMSVKRRAELVKADVVSLTRQDLRVLDSYIARKEKESQKAGPVLDDRERPEVITQLADQFVARLDALPSGTGAASEFQRLVYEILNFLFEPELTAGDMEVKTHLGTERRDIIYLNESERSFWQYVRDKYDSLLVMFECKNVKVLDMDNIAQTATYLGTRLGMLGFIITRNPPGENMIRKTYSVHNDTPSVPRKTILILCDRDLKEMIRMKQRGENPTQFAQNVYRTFRQRVQ